MLPGPRVIRKDHNPLPIRAGANAHRWWPHLNWGSSPGSIVRVPAGFVNLLKSPNTAFLDLDPGLFTCGGAGSAGMPLRNSLSQDQGTLSSLLEEDLPEGIMGHIGSC